MEPDKKIPQKFRRTVNCLNKAISKLTETLSLENQLANYCKNYIKQKDVEISVVYQPGDGYCLLYDCSLGTSVNAPVYDFLKAVKRNDYKPLDIEDIYFAVID